MAAEPQPIPTAGVVRENLEMELHHIQAGDAKWRERRVSMSKVHAVL